MEKNRSASHRLEVRVIPAALIFIAAIAYLPLVNQLGYYRDDWSLIYAGHTQGAEKLIDIYSIDRPFIGYLFSAIYTFFGDSALPYNLSAFAIRVSGGLIFFWLLNLIWPRQKLPNFIAALLFLIYPGFLQQPNGIQYQPHQLNMFASLLSIALTLRAQFEKNRLARWGLIFLSVISGIWSLLMMEYFIGLEVFRLILLWYREGMEHPGLQRARFHAFISQWFPYLLMMLGFLYWRSAIFTSSRPNTDIGSIISELISNPIYRGTLTIANVVKDFIDASFLSWAVPAYLHISAARLRDFCISAALGLAAALVVLWVIRTLTRSEEGESGGLPSLDAGWGKDAFLIGVFSVLGAIFPVVISGREVSYALSGDRFSFPSAPGAALIITGLLFWLVKKNARWWITAVLVLTAVMTHYNNAVEFGYWWKVTRNFWWQVSWRAPQIEPGTVILAQLPGLGIEEDYEVWGPANLIYYPQPGPLNLVSEVLYSGSIQGMLMGSDSERTMRTIQVYRDYNKALVLSMPTASSCVHAVDGRNPTFSSGEQPRIQLIAEKSRIELINTNAQSQIPPSAVFGSDPGKPWCYYYEKASLAQQKGDWQEIVKLFDELSELKLKPTDHVEWLPFVQALAYTGEADRAERIISIMKGDAYLRFQACTFFENERDSAVYLNTDTQKLRFLVDSFCP